MQNSGSQSFDLSVQKLDSKEALDLLRLVDDSYCAQTRWLGTIYDAVNAAAVQVQTIELLVLKAGPELSAGEIIVDAMLSTVLKSEYVKKLLTNATSVLLTRLLRPRTLLQKNSNSGRLVMTLAARGIEWPTLAKVESLDDVKVQQYYFKCAENLSEEFVTGAYKLRAKIAGFPRPRHPAKYAGDAGTTQIMELVQRWYRRQLNTVEITDRELRNAIVLNNVLPDHISKLKKLLSPEEKIQVDLVDLKRDYMRFFEVCMWVLMYPGIAGNPNDIVPESLTWNKGDVPTALADYWIRRFPYPEAEGDMSFAEVTAGRNRLSKETPTRALRKNSFVELIPYMRSIAKDLMDSGQNLLIIKPGE